VPVSPDNLLETVHDHHKDTFSWVFKREQQRNRLFLAVVGLLGLLFLHRGYPAGIAAVLNALAKLDNGSKPAFPDEIVGTVLWIILFTMTLRYLQLSVIIERQYSYLHKIEAKLAEISGHDDLFRREGKAYGKNYPVFSWWAFVVYSWIFPALLFTLTTVLIWPRLRVLHSNYAVFDIAMYLALGLSLVLRTAVPLVMSVWRKVFGHSQST